MAHPIVSRIGSSPLGRAGLATISILALAGFAAGGLPLACRMAPDAVFCTGGVVDEALGPVGGDGPAVQTASTDTLGPHPAADAATLSPTGRGEEAPQVALLAQAQAPTLTNNDLVAATFEVLRVELTSPGELTARKVKTVTINADGSVAAETAAQEPVNPEGPHPAADAATLSPAGRGEEQPAAVDDLSAESSTSLAYAPARGDVANVSGKGANVRSLPQKGGSDVLFALTGGAEVTIVEMRKGWAKVVDAQGRSGWIYGQYLSRG